MANKKGAVGEMLSLSPTALPVTVLQPSRNGDFGMHVFDGVDEFAPTAALWEDLVSIEHGLKDSGALELYGKPPPSAPADAVDFYYDPIHQYLHEIGRVDLLTAKEERSLAGMVEDGRYLAALEKHCRANPEHCDLEISVIVASLRNYSLPTLSSLLYIKTWGLSAEAISNSLFSGQNCGLQ